MNGGAEVTWKESTDKENCGVLIKEIWGIQLLGKDSKSKEIESG